MQYRLAPSITGLSALCMLQPSPRCLHGNSQIGRTMAGRGRVRSRSPKGGAWHANGSLAAAVMDIIRQGEFVEGAPQSENFARLDPRLRGKATDVVARGLVDGTLTRQTTVVDGVPETRIVLNKTTTPRSGVA